MVDQALADRANGKSEPAVGVAAAAAPPKKASAPAVPQGFALPETAAAPPTTRGRGRPFKSVGGGVGVSKSGGQQKRKVSQPASEKKRRSATASSATSVCGGLASSLADSGIGLTSFGKAGAIDSSAATVVGSTARSVRSAASEFGGDVACGDSVSVLDLCVNKVRCQHGWPNRH